MKLAITIVINIHIKQMIKKYRRCFFSIKKAKSYFKLEIIEKRDVIDTKIPNILKSSGVYNLDKIGVNSNASS